MRFKTTYFSIELGPWSFLAGDCNLEQGSERPGSWGTNAVTKHTELGGQVWHLADSTISWACSSSISFGHLVFLLQI